jgi:hypothetical protein
MQRNHRTLVVDVHDGPFMHGSFHEDAFKDIPWVFFELLMTQAQPAVFTSTSNTRTSMLSPIW